MDFEIKIDNGKIVVIRRSGGEFVSKFEGYSAEELKHKILNDISDVGVALTLGMELQKAEIALKQNLDYVPGEELRFGKEDDKKHVELQKKATEHMDKIIGTG